MKFAIVNELRQEAQPRLSGECPACGSGVFAKCGQRRIWHWAHSSVRRCDQWWEPETSWHRNWKNKFPADWQEKVHYAESGEKHVADVKTLRGVILEFQHSHLPAVERAAREAFYQNMVWLVHSNVLAKERLAEGIVKRLGSPSIFSVRPDTCSQLRNWEGSNVPVYLDFDDSDPILWRCSPGRRNGMAWLMPVPKASFVEQHLAGEAFELACFEYVEQTINRFMPTTRHRPPSAFHRHLARRERNRPRY